MTETEQIPRIPRTYDEAVRVLAQWQGEGGPTDLTIYHFPDPSEQTVRILEVSGEFLPEDVVRPFTLGRSEAFPFRSSVVLASPEEWQEIEAGRRGLPAEWELGTKQRVWP